MGTYGNYRAEIKFRKNTLAELFALGVTANNNKNKFWTLDWVNEEEGTVGISGYGRMFDFTQQEPDDKAFWESLTLTENLLLPNIKGLVESFEIASESYAYIQEDFDYINYLAVVEKQLTPEQKKFILEEMDYEEDDYVFIDELQEWLECSDLSLWMFCNEFGYDDEWCSGWGYKIEGELAQDDEGDYFATDAYDYDSYINKDLFIERITAWILTGITAELHKATA